MPSPSLGRPAVLPDLVEELFDELDFLWEHREANVFTSDWTLDDLAEHEDRAEATLDALRLTELHGVETASELLAGDDTFAAAAAAFVLFDTGAAEYRSRIAEALAEGSPEAVDGCRVALRHRDVEGFLPGLEGLLRGDEESRGSAAWDLLAFHRRPVERIERWLRAEDPAARAVALGAAGRSGSLTLADVGSAMSSDGEEVRRAALDAAARVGMPNLGAFCRDAASREIDPDPVAIAFLGVLGDASDVATLSAVLQRPGLAEHAVLAMGALGRVEAVPGLIELMADDTLGVAATAAYRRITGATDVEGERPFPPPPVEDGEDEEEALPPDPALAREDWARRSGEMTAAFRWQGGVVVSEGSLPGVLDLLTLAARRDVYLQRRAHGGGAVPDLELESLAVLQRQPR